MSTYLLLRDNKQSGPYTLEEIIVKGFKKYDLVWVDGKSAAWRYPGELEEFKLFAPVVEEQPFDRFFKKPSAEKQAPTISQTANISNAAMPKAEVVKSTTLPRVAVEIGNKKVYAVLPAKKETANHVQETISYKQINEELIKREETKPVVNDYLFEDKEIEVQSQPNIKQQYTGRSASQKDVNPYSRFLQPAILIACVLVLLGGGVFIGLSLNKGNSFRASKNTTEKQVASVNKPDVQNISGPVSAATPVEQKPVTLDEQKSAETNNGIKNDNPPEQKSAIKQDNKSITFTEKKKTNASKENSILASSKASSKQDEKTDSNSYISVPRREATHRTDAVNDNELIKNNISNLVSVSANKYHIGTFGGVSEVQLTVSNRSIYPLDLVMVQVQYVQANKKVFKTESVDFRNIRAGESMMLEAPESSRGIKIQYKVTLINSKEASISYSGT